jgi:two-component system phosphate regulon response regulator PhoB
MALVLIIEDEPDLQQVLDYNLRREGLRTAVASRGAEALRLVRREVPDLVLLDLMLPDMSGTEVCREIKRDPMTSRASVIMLTARGEEVDRIVGFELGADDYVVKPFSLRELVLRVKAVLRRAEPTGEPTERVRAGPFTVDRAGHRVLVGGMEIPATALEFRILELLVERRGRVQTRERLLADAWRDDDEVSERAIDTHIKRLREKLGDAADWIETVRGVGYRFREPAEAEPGAAEGGGREAGSERVPSEGGST